MQSEKGETIIRSINRIGDALTRIAIKIENSNINFEVLVMAMYTVIHFIISYYHEPWFDEAEAWQIARSASLKDLMFYVPHLEGHTPMWDFILMPWIKLGVPYEVSLSVISYIFMGGAVALIVWKSPFPRVVRLLVPFTYFFLYQYGVVCRPYCVIAFLLMLVACLYPTKDVKTGRFVGCLMLLACIHAYGLLIAGGITIVWIIEIWNGENVRGFLRRFIKDKRAWWMFSLLLIALAIMWQILPNGNTFVAVGEEPDNHLVKRVIYTFFVMPMDTLVSDVWHDYYGLGDAKLDIVGFVSSSIMGLLFWIGVFLYGRKKKTRLLWAVPYGLMASFGAIKYMSKHHIGVALLFIVCWLWISLEKVTDNTDIEVKTSLNDQRLLLSAMKIVSVLIAIISIRWSVVACVNDIRYEYAQGRNEARFICENNLQQYNIMSYWLIMRYIDTKEIADFYLNETCDVCNIMPYLDSNIFFNFNEGKEDRAFVLHEVMDETRRKELVDKYKNIVPEVLIGKAELDLIYDEKYDLEEDYTLIYRDIEQRPWKDGINMSVHRIYMLNDLAQKNGYVKNDDNSFFEKDEKNK